VVELDSLHKLNIAKMRFQPRQSSVLLLALASAATALVADSIDPRAEAAAVQDPRDVPNPNAPIDGKDGVPHTGPFVTTDGDEKPGTPELRAPSEKIDTTGLEGGVSAKEGAATGEKAPAQPEAPKEAPPLPHSEEEKLRDGPGGLDDTLVPEVRNVLVLRLSSCLTFFLGRCEQGQCV
jgi:hypothetical protein